MKTKIFFTVFFLFSMLSAHAQNLIFTSNPAHMTNVTIKKILLDTDYYEEAYPNIFECNKHFEEGDEVIPIEIELSDNLIIEKFPKLDDTDTYGGLGISFFDSIILEVNKILNEVPFTLKDGTRFWINNNVGLFIDERDPDYTYYTVVYKRGDSAK